MLSGRMLNPPTQRAFGPAAAGVLSEGLSLVSSRDVVMRAGPLFVRGDEGAAQPVRPPGFEPGSTFLR